MKSSEGLFERRRRRVRTRLARKAVGRLRLSVHRSNKNIYACLLYTSDAADE